VCGRAERRRVADRPCRGRGQPLLRILHISGTRHFFGGAGQLKPPLQGAEPDQDKAVDLCLIKDADLVLADRLVRALDKSIKTLPEENKGQLSNQVRCVRQRRDVGYVQAVEVARLARHLKPWRYLSPQDLAVVDLRSSVLLFVPCRELLVNQGSEDVGVPS
jgi:hypothetical protein